jgi:hypothetical protein
MKLSELKPCAVCQGKIAPVWYVVRFTQAMINPLAANQVLGLRQIFGGSMALAEAMAPEPDCVLVFGDENPELMYEVNVCQDCFLGKPLDMAILMESNRQKEVVPK